MRRGRVQHNGDVSPTLMTGNNAIVRIEKMGKQYRIRKLTPRECWRLMCFTDKDFEAAQAVNSNSQLYKEAGNSICKNVLIAIFSQLGIQNQKKWNELSDEARYKLIYKDHILGKGDKDEKTEV